MEKTRTIKRSAQERKRAHISALLRLKELDTSVPVLEHVVNNNERYHMACLHRQWFGSKRKKHEAQGLS